RLLGVELTLPGAAEVERLAAHLEAAGVPFTRDGSGLTLLDPAGNRLGFRATA
ncbi:hypothetical protein L1280_001546, partial [Deinococcus sp. HSC-46F16]|nr:hypothetical protein [Deinococcus sp. HSC-46F16]